MKKYRKRPVVIEAVQWTGRNGAEINYFCGESCGPFEGDRLMIKTLEGEHIASRDDFIIKGIKGEFYPCKPDIFRATYDLVDEPWCLFEVL